MKKPVKRRKYADGGDVQNPAAPPIGTTDLSGAGAQAQNQAQPPSSPGPGQTSPYYSPSDYGTPVGAMKTQGNNLYVQDRMSGQGATAQGYAKGGMVNKRGKVRGCGVAKRGLTKGKVY
jgi:hypothetical protein